ncbi:hypothetical protein [Pararhodobacter sp. SW119]|uniref:hypothetical protein n=1 Tax=Pararhodobacter sp. SW119 TaxID=2780075 RepID=UPI001AE0E0AB|nr:hypothetical protein [Pararhodobacter sp. SW119]
MQIVALDGAKLLALMLAGGIFALAGLWLMFRPQPAGEAARIELFGLKFQASSAGLLVFLIGALFLAVPIFVPEKPASTGAQARAGVGGTGLQTDESGTGEGQRAIILPGGAEAAESEPNDTIHEANQIMLGVYYSGNLTPSRNDSRDWFVFDTAELHGQEVDIKIRSLAQNNICKASAHDDREQLIATWDFPREGSSNYRRVFVGNAAHMFVRIFNDYNYSCRYELRIDRTPE